MRLRSRDTRIAPTLLAIVSGWLCIASAAAQEEGQPAGAIFGAGGVAAGEPFAEPAPPPGASDGTAAPTGAGEGGPTTGSFATGGGAAATGQPGTTAGPSSGGVSSGLVEAGTTYGYGSPMQADNIGGLLAAAMSRNPDITVAESKVRAAQCELDRTRLDVSRQIVDTFQSVRFARKSIEIAKAQVAQCKDQQGRLREMHQTGVVPMSEVAAADVAAREAELALIKAEASLEATFATLDYLTGGQAAPGGGVGMPGMPMGSGMRGAVPGGGFSGSLGIPGAGSFRTSGGSGDAGGGTGTAGGPGVSGAPPKEGSKDGGGTTPNAALPAGVAANAESGGGRANSGLVFRTATTVSAANTFHERLRQKLYEPTTVDVMEAPLGDVMRYLDDLHGITNVIIDRQAPDGRVVNDTPITLKLEKVPLSAALKAIEDIADVKFVVTEYGLRVTVRETQIEDSVSLREFVRPKPSTGVYYFGGGGGAATSSQADPFGASGAGSTDGGGANPATRGASPGGGEDAVGVTEVSPETPKQ